MPSLADLTDGDLYSTVAKLITGDDDADGVVIDDVEHDDTGIDVVLADEGGEQRRVSLMITTD
jgi:hypothetical protein